MEFSPAGSYTATEVAAQTSWAQFPRVRFVHADRTHVSTPEREGVWRRSATQLVHLWRRGVDPGIPYKGTRVDLSSVHIDLSVSDESNHKDSA